MTNDADKSLIDKQLLVDLEIVKGLNASRERILDTLISNSIESEGLKKDLLSELKEIHKRLGNGISWTNHDLLDTLKEKFKNLEEQQEEIQKITEDVQKKLKKIHKKGSKDE